MASVAALDARMVSDTPWPALAKSVAATSNVSAPEFMPVIALSVACDKLATVFCSDLLVSMDWASNCSTWPDSEPTAWPVVCSNLAWRSPCDAAACSACLLSCSTTPATWSPTVVSVSLSFWEDSVCDSDTKALICSTNAPIWAFIAAWRASMASNALPSLSPMASTVLVPAASMFAASCPNWIAVACMDSLALTINSDMPSNWPPNISRICDAKLVNTSESNLFTASPWLELTPCTALVIASIGPLRLSEIAFPTSADIWPTLWTCASICWVASVVNISLRSATNASLICADCVAAFSDEMTSRSRYSSPAPPLNKLSISSRNSSTCRQSDVTDDFSIQVNSIAKKIAEAETKKAWPTELTRLRSCSCALVGSSDTSKLISPLMRPKNVPMMPRLVKLRLQATIDDGLLGEEALRQSSGPPTHYPALTVFVIIPLRMQRLAVFAPQMAERRPRHRLFTNFAKLRDISFDLGADGSQCGERLIQLSRQFCRLADKAHQEVDRDDD